MSENDQNEEKQTLTNSGSTNLKYINKSTFRLIINKLLSAKEKKTTFKTSKKTPTYYLQENDSYSCRFLQKEVNTLRVCKEMCCQSTSPSYIL